MADAANAPSYTTPQTQQTRMKKFLWTMNGTSTGVPVRVADWADKDIQAFGTWGGATLVFEGSLDPRANPAHADYASAVFKTLTDTTETALSFTSDTDVIQVLQGVAEWVRPKTTGGTGTSLTFALGAKK